jgi:xylulokinase
MKLAMGIDSSTQGMKAVLIAPKEGGIIASESVNFGRDLPEYESPEGVLRNADPLIKHSDPLMWVKALETLFEKMRKNKFPLGDVSVICGCGQQHGSVYLNGLFPEIISARESSIPLSKRLEPALSRKTSPVWMDSSTTKQCEILSKKIGMAEIRRRTGSPPVERFTGPQIMKFFTDEKAKYNETKFIHLVSSFMCSALCGKSSPADYGDAAGMNLLNIETLDWDDEICSVTAPDLKSKLPRPVISTTIAGTISDNFRKYGFSSKKSKIVVWTGDNPASLVGTGGASGESAVISLGTSDTFFAAMRSPKTDPEGYGHVFGNPAGGFMSLICFKNGSLAREKIKEKCGVDWDYFGLSAFEKSAPGNNGNIMLPYFVPEITPLVMKRGVKLFGSAKFVSGKAGKDEKIRAIVESQMLRMKLHSSWLGEKFKKIKITGGGSQSPGICQVAADVFDACVETISIPDSAALGAAIIAACAEGDFSFSEMSAKFAKPVSKIVPNSGNVKIYRALLDKYAEFEKNQNLS